MINIETEKNKTFSTEDICDIVSFSLTASNQLGYINEYIFERALYLHSAIIVYPDRKDELTIGIANDIAGLWDSLVADGTIEEMMRENRDDLDLVAEVASQWLDNYNKYNLSARGVLDTLNLFSSGMVENAAKTLANTADESGVKNVIDIANHWGMDRGINASNEKDNTPEDSLF